MVGLMYHACSNLPSCRKINEIYAQATSGRVKQATLLIIIIMFKMSFNSMLKCIFLYVCVCVCACYTYGIIIVGMSHIIQMFLFINWQLNVTKPSKLFRGSFRQYSNYLQDENSWKLSRRPKNTLSRETCMKTIAV